MSAPGPEEALRVEELLRANAELAAEIRRLTHDRGDSTRSGPMPSARRLTKLEDERDTALAELERSRVGLAAMTTSRDELSAEVARLRFGVAGSLRRALARLLRR